MAKEGSSFLLLSSFFGFKQEHEKFHVMRKSRSCRVFFVKTEKSSAVMGVLLKTEAVEVCC